MNNKQEKIERAVEKLRRVCVEYLSVYQPTSENEGEIDLIDAMDKLSRLIDPESSGYKEE